MATNTATRRRVRSIDTTKVIDIAKIARADGFPKFHKQLTGYGNYVAYTNETEELVRVYDPRTGKKMHDYKPANVSPNFHNPFQTIPLTPAPLRSNIPLY